MLCSWWGCGKKGVRVERGGRRWGLRDGVKWLPAGEYVSLGGVGWRRGLGQAEGGVMSLPAGLSVVGAHLDLDWLCEERAERPAHVYAWICEHAAVEEPRIKDTEQKYICTFRYSSASADKASEAPMPHCLIHFNQDLCTALFACVPGQGLQLYFTSQHLLFY